MRSVRSCSIAVCPTRTASGCCSASRAPPNWPVVMRTARSTPELTRGALALGAYRLVDKPFKTQAIEKCLRRHTRRGGRRTDLGEFPKRSPEARRRVRKRPRKSSQIRDGPGRRHTARDLLKGTMGNNRYALIQAETS